MYILKWFSDNATTKLILNLSGREGKPINAVTCSKFLLYNQKMYVNHKQYIDSISEQQSEDTIFF